MIRTIVYASSGVVRAGIRTVLDASSDLDVVSTVASGAMLEQVLDTDSHDVLVAAVSDEETQDIVPFIERAASLVVLASRDPDRWLELGLRLEGFAVLESTADPEAIVSATLAAAHGLFVVQPGRLAALTVRPSTTEAMEVGDRLTPRETEVLTMMAEGLGNKTIAYRLGISDHTVKFHVGSILRKLEAESRTEAVTQGIRQGYISV